MGLYFSRRCFGGRGLWFHRRRGRGHGNRENSLRPVPADFRRDSDPRAGRLCPRSDIDMRKNRLILTCLLASWPLFGGCGQFADLFGPAVTVTLVNNGDFDVKATVAYSDNPAISKSDLASSGTEIDFTIPKN